MLKTALALALLSAVHQEPPPKPNLTAALMFLGEPVQRFHFAESVDELLGTKTTMLFCIHEAKDRGRVGSETQQYETVKFGVELGIDDGGLAVTAFSFGHTASTGLDDTLGITGIGALEEVQLLYRLNGEKATIWKSQDTSRDLSVSNGTRSERARWLVGAEDLLRLSEAPQLRVSNANTHGKMEFALDEAERGAIRWFVYEHLPGGKEAYRAWSKKHATAKATETE